MIDGNSFPVFACIWMSGKGPCWAERKAKEQGPRGWVDWFVLSASVTSMVVSGSPKRW